MEPKSEIAISTSLENGVKDAAAPETAKQDEGAKAWMTVVGATVGLFSFRPLDIFIPLVFIKNINTGLDYYTRIFLSEHSPSKIAWIGSFQLMMPFLFGVISGKIFDSGYFYVLEISGSVLFTVSLFMLSLVKSQRYFEVFLSQGLGMGLGLGLLFVPTISVVVHHFRGRKVLATGIVMSGSSLGAVVFPIVMNHLIESIGFPKAVRASAYIVLGMLVIANCIMRTAYDKAPRDHDTPMDIAGFFLDPSYFWCSIGALTAMFGFYFPYKLVIYLQLYSVTHGIDTTLAFYSLAILNAAGTIGRLSGNYLAQIYGPVNILVPLTVITAASIFSVFGVHDTGSLVAVAIFHGFFAGAWLSVSVAAIGTLARHPNEIGARTGLALALSSFGSLGAAPVQGALLKLDLIEGFDIKGFDWNKPIIFSGIMMLVTAVFFSIGRAYLVRERSTNNV